MPQTHPRVHLNRSAIHWTWFRSLAGGQGMFCVGQGCHSLYEFSEFNAGRCGFPGLLFIHVPEDFGMQLYCLALWGLRSRDLLLKALLRDSEETGADGQD